MDHWDILVLLTVTMSAYILLGELLLMGTRGALIPQRLAVNVWTTILLMASVLKSQIATTSAVPARHTEVLVLGVLKVKMTLERFAIMMEWQTKHIVIMTTMEVSCVERHLVQNQLLGMMIQTAVKGRVRPMEFFALVSSLVSTVTALVTATLILDFALVGLQLNAVVANLRKKRKKPVRMERFANGANSLTELHKENVSWRCQKAVAKNSERLWALTGKWKVVVALFLLSNSLKKSVL